MKIPMEFPEKHGHLFDLLHEMFGFGFYDDIATEETGGEPWHKVRMGEISRLKALMNGRQASFKHVIVAAWYARKTGVAIVAPYELLALIPPAMKAYNQELRADVGGDLKDQIADAVIEATEAGEDGWAERLIRANDRSTLDEWRNR